MSYDLTGMVDVHRQHREKVEKIRKRQLELKALRRAPRMQEREVVTAKVIHGNSVSTVKYRKGKLNDVKKAFYYSLVK